MEALQRIREIAENGIEGIHGYTSWKDEDGQSVVLEDNLAAAFDAAAEIEALAPGIIAEFARLENQLSGAKNTAHLRLKWARAIRQERDEARADLRRALEVGEGATETHIELLRLREKNERLRYERNRARADLRRLQQMTTEQSRGVISEKTSTSPSKQDGGSE